MFRPRSVSLTPDVVRIIPAAELRIADRMGLRWPLTYRCSFANAADMDVPGAAGFGASRGAP
jgi:hypothetical protein